MTRLPKLTGAVAGATVVLALLTWSVWPAGAAVTTQSSWGARLTCTADTSGFCTAAHPAGVVPDAVVVTPTLPAMVAVDSVTAASFRVRFCRAVSSSGACTPLSGSRTFFVHVDWTPGASPSPSDSSASPSASVSASPTPSPTGPPATFPDATNAGVPAGTALTVVNGDVTLSTAGATYDAREVNGCIRVTAPGVTISRTKVHCGGPSAIGYFDQGVQTARLTVVDSEVDCRDTAGRTAIGDTNITVLRVNIHGCENGLDVDQWVTVRDSYIHDLANTATSHTDGIQFAHYLDGCSTSACEVNHARAIIIEHNRIYGTGAQGAGTSAIISNPAGDADIVIKNNLLAGGAYSLYCDYQGNGTNYQVVDNRVSRIFSANGGAFGPWTGCTDEAVASGNVWHESGAALT